MTLKNDSKSISAFQAWLLAIRPRTLPAAPSGVIVGSALAILHGSFKPLEAFFALLIALLLQIGSNLANDVFDFERGSDSGERQGPTRVTQAGYLRPKQVKIGMLVVFGLAGLLGLYLAFSAGWVVIGIGLAAILAAVAYTGGPFPLGYHGLGDLFVFLFFGVAAVAGTYYVQALKVVPVVWAMSIPVGMLIVAILVVNNYRDLAQDRRSGKRTLAVMFGERFTKWEFGLCIFLPSLIVLAFVVMGWLPWHAMLAFLTFPFSYVVWREFNRLTGRPLNKVLAKTGQLALNFSLLFLIGVLLS